MALGAFSGDGTAEGTKRRSMRQHKDVKKSLSAELEKVSEEESVSPSDTSASASEEEEGRAAEEEEAAFDGDSDSMSDEDEDDDTPGQQQDADAGDQRRASPRSRGGSSSKTPSEATPVSPVRVDEPKAQSTGRPTAAVFSDPVGRRTRRSASQAEVQQQQQGTEAPAASGRVTRGRTRSTARVEVDAVTTKSYALENAMNAHIINSKKAVEVPKGMYSAFGHNWANMENLQREDLSHRTEPSLNEMVKNRMVLKLANLGLSVGVVGGQADDGSMSVDFSLEEEGVVKLKADVLPKFRAIKKNVFSVDRFVDREDDPEVCECRRTKEKHEGGHKDDDDDGEKDGDFYNCGEDCLNRMLMIECTNKTCSMGELCTNRQFQKRTWAPLKPFKTMMKGWGLRLTADVQVGVVLIEFCVCFNGEFPLFTVEGVFCSS